MKLLVENIPAELSRVSRMQRAKSDDAANSRFTLLLQSGYRSGNFTPLIEHLKSLPPSKADLEIRSLDPRVRDGRSELSDFVIALTSHLKLRRDFELVNAWMAVFLKVNADIVRRCSEPDASEHHILRNALDSWSHEQQREVIRLAELVGYCRGVVGFLRSTR